ncbi:ribulose-phosphate 3-epimerase [Frankia sp. CNm7]|nr:ribulose-phosphate 3-epimerase [Frankia nepalensis]MBL7522580.1 ribulose-phosphate 3-epimerase [Frankia nepalensis]
MTTEQTTSASRPAGWLAALPERRLLLDVSLWSADLAALGAELDRTSGVADLVHFDIADGYFGPDLMFSPAMLAALRARTTVPFHAHVLARRPMALIDAAATAGADLITVPAEIEDVARALHRIRENGKAAGLALGVDTRIVDARPHLGAIDVLVVVCTPGCARDAALTMAALRRVHAARRLLEATGRQRTVRLLAEGGVGARTVGPLRVAGVDGLVTDLPVLSDDPAGIAHWLRSQHPARSRPAPRPPRNGQGFTRRLT